MIRRKLLEKHGENLVKALREVSVGQSLHAASVKYNIPYSSLFRAKTGRNEKHGDNIAKALHEVSLGQTLHAAASKYGVPYSTLCYRYRMNSRRTLATRPIRKKWTDKEMKLVVQAVAQGSTISSAAKRHGIPAPTVWSAIYNRNKRNKKISQDDIDKALQELIEGKSLASVSFEQRIPKRLLLAEMKKKHPTYFILKNGDKVPKNIQQRSSLINSQSKSNQNEQNSQSESSNKIYSPNLHDSLFFSSVCYEMDPLPAVVKQEFKRNVLELLNETLQNYGL